jgi:hypothetical protein
MGKAITFCGIDYQMVRVLDAILLAQAAKLGCLVATPCQRCGEHSFGTSCPGCTPADRLN